MLSIAKLSPGAGWRYYFRGVMVGDGHRRAGMSLRAAQEEAGVPLGRWTGQGLAGLGLASGDVVTERQAALLLGEGRHPDADAIEARLLAAGEGPAAARRATLLGRSVGHIASPVLALDLVFRPPSTAQVLWALADDSTRRVLETCHETSLKRTIAWVEKAVAQVRWGSGGRYRAPILGGLIVAVFRHYESRSCRPLLHEHALVSIKVRRPDGKWGNLAAEDVFKHVVAAGTLYALTFMEEVSERLAVAWEPREVTPGERPVMEIAGIDHALIHWQSTRRQQVKDAVPAIAAAYKDRHGHIPGERASYALYRQAANDTRPPKGPSLPLSTLRHQWRTSAIRAIGADAVDQLLEKARAAAAAVWARIRPTVDVALAAVDTVAVVYVMRGAFQRRHLLAEARRHLAYVLRGRRHAPGLDERIVDTAIAEHTQRTGRHALTADFRSLYPHEAEDDASALRPLTRRRTATRYERAQLASTALVARARAARRSRRPDVRSPAYKMPTTSRGISPLLEHERHREHRKERQQTTDLAALQSSKDFIAAFAARIQDGIQARAVADTSPPPTPALSPPQQYDPTQNVSRWQNRGSK